MLWPQIKPQTNDKGAHSMKPNQRHAKRKEERKKDEYESQSKEFDVESAFCPLPDLFTVPGGNNQPFVALKNIRLVVKHAQIKKKK